MQAVQADEKKSLLHCSRCSCFSRLQSVRSGATSHTEAGKVSLQTCLAGFGEIGDNRVQPSLVLSRAGDAAQVRDDVEFMVGA